MANKKTDISNVEREYIIPLREKCRPVPRYKKTPKAIKTIKEFLIKHMRIYDRDLKKIKIDRYLNEFVWFRGIKKPPIKVKVKAIKKGDLIHVELVDVMDKLKFKKLREEKRKQKGKEFLEKKKESKKSIMEKAKETMKKPAEEVKTEEEKEQKKKQESEKIKSVAEAGNKAGKAEAKKTKHQASAKTKQPKRPIRQVMNK